MCTMANMVLSYSCHCHALLSAYELSARAAGATACMRVRVCHMVHRGLRDCPFTYLRVTVCAIHSRVCACVHFSFAESHDVNAYLLAHSVCMWALARACSCGAVVLRLHRHASVRSCVCVCECERACVCMRAYAARARVYVMGRTCVGFRCGSSSHRRSSRYAGVAPVSFSGFAWCIGCCVHFVHVLAHAYVHVSWQRALLHSVAYDVSCVA